MFSNVPVDPRGWALEKSFSRSGAGGKLLPWGRTKGVSRYGGGTLLSLQDPARETSLETLTSQAAWQPAFTMTGEHSTGSFLRLLDIVTTQANAELIFSHCLWGSTDAAKGMLRSPGSSSCASFNS